MLGKTLELGSAYIYTYLLLNLASSDIARSFACFPQAPPLATRRDAFVL